MALGFVVNYHALTAATIGPRRIRPGREPAPAAEIKFPCDTLDRIDGIGPPGLNLNPPTVGG